MDDSYSGRNRLRLVTILVLLFAFVAFAVGQWLSANWLYGESFDAAERRDALARARHAQAIVRGQADSMERYAVDNANWDDAYTHMLGADPGYPDRMFSAQSFSIMRLDAFAFVGLNGKVVSARQFDSNKRRLADAAAAVMAAVDRQGVIGERLSRVVESQGFAKIGSGIYVWGAAAIRRTDGSGAPVGFLVLMGRLDDAFLRTASNTLDSQLAFDIRPGATAGLPAVPIPVGYSNVDFSADGSSKLQARFPLGALDGATTLDLTITTPRIVHAAAIRTSGYFLWSTLGFGLLVSAFAVWFVQRRLLGPLQIASDGLVRIGNSGDLSQRLPKARHDDQIARLVDAANVMLAQLESKRDVETARDFALAESRLKSDFLARMSHEIRTPMNAVMGMTELLLATHLSPRQRRLASTVHGSAESLLDVINDILDFSKIEAGKLELSMREFDLRDAVEDAVELLAERAHSKGLELLSCVNPDVPRVIVGDAVRLRQILTNLLGNSIKFTEHGEIIVRVELRGMVNPARARLRLSVADTGIGIPLEAQRRIFDSFTQADDSVTRRFGGTGLGLAIVKQLVRLMNGSLAVQSAPAAGSTFSVEIEADVSQPLFAADSGMRRLAGLRVVVLEPGVWAREVLTAQLAAAGAEVGEDAPLGPAPPAAVDVMVVDRRMMTAATMAFIDRQRKELRTAPRIVVLSWIDARAEKDGLESAGIDAFLTKPVRERQLLDAVSPLEQHVPDMAARRAPSAVPERVASRRGGADDLMLRVLVAEDNVINSEVAKGMLDSLGCVTCVAANGREALEIFDPAAFDVILMDCQMPEMDGFAATEEIRRREMRAGVRPTPIIALTANAMSGDRERCIAAGMDDFVTKPYTLEQLKRVLSAVRGEVSHAESSSN